MAEVSDDNQWMSLALEEAILASEKNEVPVGAVLVSNGNLIARAGNSPISTCDPTAHAEINVIRLAGKIAGNYRLPETTLYVTLEPCLMCVGAILHARIRRVVFGAYDPKTGALVSKYRLGNDGLANHSLEISGGVLAHESSKLLRHFFQKRRK